MDITRLKQILEVKQQIVITSHQAPDGDAVGSSLALGLFLISQGHQVHFILPDPVPNYLNWLPNADQFLIYSFDPEACDAIIDKATIIFSLDYNSLLRLKKDFAEKVKRSSAFKIMIDHHQAPETFSDLIFSEPQRASTCEILFDILVALNPTLISSDIATALYLGILTDTGSFKFPTVSARTHQIVAQLIDFGASPHRIFSATFEQQHLQRIQLQAYALCHKMEILPHCQAVIVSLSESDFHKYNAQKEDAEGIVNQPLYLAGIQLSIFCREEEGRVKISFRSKGSLDVNVFAKTYFAGGGHVNAAGGSSLLSLSATLDRIRELLPQQNWYV